MTKGGATELDIPLVLRPTSETAMYPVFALWIRSHKDLPLNVYQVVNTFRYETKTTRPFLRVREIHFFEEHTCQVDEAAAAERVRSNLAAFTAMARCVRAAVRGHRRPEWDKFPGAFYSVALDIPVGGARTLQIGTPTTTGRTSASRTGSSSRPPTGRRSTCTRRRSGCPSGWSEPS